MAYRLDANGNLVDDGGAMNNWGANIPGLEVPGGAAPGFDMSRLATLGGYAGGSAPQTPNQFRYTPWGADPGQAKGLNYFGANMPLFSAGIQGLSQLGNIYLGIKQLGLAKDSFNLQKRAFETNLANSTSSYNTQIRDRIAGRSYATEEERQAALKAALLPTGG